MKKESDYTTPKKVKSKKLAPYPFKKGEIIGNYTINNDDYVYHAKRYQVELICECGKVRYKRLSHLLNGKNIWCAKCRGWNYYPKHRKIRSGYYELEIHATWLTQIKQNLIRGARTLECNITNADLRNQYDLQNGKCSYTGIELNVLFVKKSDSNASIDRIDSNVGYIKGNVQWVYKPVNIMKNNFSEEEFLYVCKKIGNFKR